MERLSEPHLNQERDKAWREEKGGKIYLPVRIATQVVGLCQGFKYCRECDCRDIINKSGGIVLEGDFIEESTLPKLQEVLEKKF